MDRQDVYAALYKKYGPGERPAARMSLFHKLAALCESDNADLCYHIIAAAAADSDGKNKPAHYFAHTVIARLREAGIVASRSLTVEVQQ